ncbi:hypothetical protein D3C79_915950 [compost metagenome]
MIRNDAECLCACVGMVHYNVPAAGCIRKTLCDRLLIGIKNDYNVVPHITARIILQHISYHTAITAEEFQ